MTDSEKLELLLSKVTDIGQEQHKMRSDINAMQDEISGIKGEICGMKGEIDGIKADMATNNNFLLTEMERLHDIALSRIEAVAQDVAAIKNDRNITNFLIGQVSELKGRVEVLESKIA